MSPNTPVSRFYGVAKGRVPGVYTDWATAEKQIKGWKGGPKYKKFTTCAEAEAFVRQYGDMRIEEAPGLSANNTDSDKWMIARVEGDEVAAIRDTKRARRSSPDGKVASVLVDVNEADELESNQDTGASSVAENATQSGVIRIWTDGSSRGNGKVGATAGLGVHFGNADSR
jgi:ribonuclease HI